MPNTIKRSSDGLALQVTKPAQAAGLVEETDDEPTRIADLRVFAFDGLLLVIDLDCITDENIVELAPGQHTLQVAPAGQGRESALIDQQATLESNTDYTVAAAGRLDNPEMFVFVDETQPASGDQARLRAVHLSPDAPAVDIAADGNVLVEGLKFGDASDYVEVPAGSYTIEVRPAGEKEAVATFDVPLERGTVVSAFAVGLLETENKAQAFDLISAVDAGGESMTTTTQTTM
jgi:hypothetical protein